MLESREYWRPAGENPWSTVTVRLLLMNTGVFVLQSLLEFHARTVYGGFMRILALNPEWLFHGYLWQLLTFQFLHANFWHLLFNSIAIFFVGRELEIHLGRTRYLVLYLVSGAVGGLCQALLGLLFPTHFGASVVGASAGAFGIVAAYATLCPEHVFSVMLFFVFTVNIRAKYLLMGCLGLAIFGVLVPTDGIAHAAHLGGMLFGIAFIRSRLQEMGFNWPNFRRSPPRAHQLVATPAGRQKTIWRTSKPVDEDDLPPAEFISKEVDPILDKISAQGIHSLTARERAILEAARKKMDKR